METNHLLSFVAVAEELSFTRAAQRLHMVQSTVSAAIKTVEREVGRSLFVRSTRSVELTAAGRELLPVARRLLADVDELRSLGNDPGVPLRDRLRIGLLTNLERLELPSLLGAFRRQHPQVELWLQTLPRGSTDVVAGVRAGRLDLGFSGGLPAAAMRGLRKHRLIEEPFTVLLPPEHRLADRASVPITELVDEPFVELPRGFGTRVLLDGWLRRRGLRRHVAVEVPDLATVPDFVAAGLGVAVVPMLVSPGRADVVAVPATPKLRWELFVVTAAGRGQPVRDALVDELLRRV
ncbi:LysR substrate-binding domain-containing protein [Nakamurella aerolata]|uniref:LysR family transcriptional regulator n=1 Tax=Nakamurella aerolata TaxID=1656892 RepID=A0A849A5M5_9ACTN|nr:LysR family transcriptional regulator [Nakamurella aerolata]